MQLQKLAKQPIQRMRKSDDDFAFNFLIIEEVGAVVPQHVHDFDHTLLISVGGVRVWTGDGFDGPCEDRWAPDTLNIPAGTKHKFMSLAPITGLVCAIRKDANGNLPLSAEHQIEGAH